jgi:peptidoglycan/xylan/chitin deacetylase (PgdA/CDA1 family)
MTSDQLKAIDAQELVEIGGHTRTHALLSAVDERRQADEVAGGRMDLEVLVSHPVTSFAYPYGYSGSFDDRTVRIVREAGYERACTTVAGRVPSRTDAFRVPRHQVRDWDGDSFIREVASWLAA